MTEQIISDLASLVGSDNVVTDRTLLARADGPINRAFEKAFGYQPTHLPVCVVLALGTEDVRRVVAYCHEQRLSLIVKTGASSTEDNLTVVDDRTVMLDASGLNSLIEFDEHNMTATVGCGMPLAQLESYARAKGLTTGHGPQSLPLAQMGGLVATRSIGQFSTLYGGIEDLVIGLEAVMPDGQVVRIRNVPRRAAGPDLRHLFIGSEGALAVITEVSVKLFRYYPDDMWKGAYVADSFDAGVDFIRDVVTAGFRPSVVRLYDKPDMDLSYGGAGLADGEVCVFFVAEGPPEIAAATGAGIARHADGSPGLRHADVGIVDHWLATRNDICKVVGTEAMAKAYRDGKTYLYTLEVSASWTEIKSVYHTVTSRLPAEIDTLVFLGGHVSHSYQTGTNIYFVYAFQPHDPSTVTEAEGWHLVRTICEQVLREPTGGIAHHHGLGKVRAKMLDAELGTSSHLMRQLKQTFDPRGIMNPGVVVPLEAQA